MNHHVKNLRYTVDDPGPRVGSRRRNAATPAFVSDTRAGGTADVQLRPIRRLLHDVQ